MRLRWRGRSAFEVPGRSRGVRERGAHARGGRGNGGGTAGHGGARRGAGWAGTRRGAGPLMAADGGWGRPPATSWSPRACFRLHICRSERWCFGQRQRRSSEGVKGGVPNPAFQPEMDLRVASASSHCPTMCRADQRRAFARKQPRRAGCGQGARAAGVAGRRQAQVGAFLLTLVTPPVRRENLAAQCAVLGPPRLPTALESQADSQAACHLMREQVE